MNANLEICGGILYSFQIEFIDIYFLSITQKLFEINRIDTQMWVFTRRNIHYWLMISTNLSLGILNRNLNLQRF